ncbi:uncharacterized protein FOMMEDRAFT_170189 [Fomitiporia mediterranea MF3/22]|uniref:uncharacterized protein n=1 Tax=Fomitiporia mediterranea (strain MF3/22) TaxID=694068 RepID=UPI000440972B|nr:uncharacterized protein FOMMEDRAFT_170189 [Fomitiporia mediterranea MF3/22]EJD00200.1 hypothetical protein FOMMEDRAFT_170189 [Fomitiporia mediterranea MF3/22]
MDSHIRLLLLLCFVLLVKKICVSRIQELLLPSEDVRTSSNTSFSFSGDDFPRTLPIGPLGRVKAFRENSIHFSLEDDAEWEAAVPGDGLIYLGKQRRPFMVSMFHQLRCLDIVRREIVSVAHSGKPDISPASDLGQYCVNYLRQMAMCRGDLDLDVIMGWPHPAVYPDLTECSDWEVVYKEVEMNQAMYARG